MRRSAAFVLGLFLLASPAAAAASPAAAAASPAPADGRGTDPQPCPGAAAPGVPPTWLPPSPPTTPPTSAPPAPTAPSPCSSNYLSINPLGPAAGAAAKAVTGVVGQVATVTIGEVLRGLSDWVAHGTADFLTTMGQVIAVHVQPDLGATWFVDHYMVMAGTAVLLVLPLLLAAAISAIVRQDASALIRAVGVQLPLAALGTFLGIQLVSMALAITDELCGQVSSDTNASTLNFLTILGQRLDALTTSPVGAFGVLLVSMLMAVGVLLVSLELVMRDASVYVAVLFLPLALAGLVWPATVRWGRRLVELLVVLILSKFIIVAIISLGAAALSSGVAKDQLSGVIAGGALMLLAAFAPYALLRLVPIVEAGAIGHMEGVSRRANPARVANDARSTVQGLLPASLTGVGSPSDRPDPGSAAGDAAAHGAVARADKSNGVAEFEGAGEDWACFGAPSPSGAVPKSGEAGGGVAVLEPTAVGAAAAVGLEAASATKDRAVQDADRLLRSAEERDDRGH